MAVKKTIEIDVKNNFKKSAKDLDGLNKELKETAQETKNVQKSTKEAKTDMGALGATRFTGVIASVGKTVKAFFTLRGAIIATGLGALLILLVSIKSAFTRSEEGQNKFAKILAVIGSVVDNLLDVLSSLGKTIISAFENPVESVKKLAKAIKDNIVNRLIGLLELLPALGSAIEEVFSGNFSKAGRIATNAVAKVTLGVENFTEKVEAAAEATKEFLAEVEREAAIVAGIADQRAKADKIERKLIVERAKAQTEISALQLKSRQEEKFSEEQRMSFAKQALKRTDELLAGEEEILKIRFEAIKLENTLAESNKEAKNAEATAEAALINLQTRRLDAEKTATKFLNTLRDELKAKNKARKKVEEKALIFGVEFTEKMSNEEIAILTVAAEKKFKLKIKEGQELIKTQDAQDKLSFKLMEDGFAKELAALVKLQEDRLAIAGDNEGLEAQVIADFNEKKLALEQEYKDKLKVIDDKATEDSLANIEKERLAKLAGIDAGLDFAKKGANAVQALGDAIFANKMSKLEKGSKEEEALAKKQFKFNKALQLGGAIIDAGKAITASLAAAPIALVGVPNPLGIASLAFAATTSAANIAKIASTKFESPGGVASTPSPSLGGGGAPNFNVVGDSGVNQLASLQQQPAQAYVVSGDVTTAQALDRNRIQNATL